MAAVELRAIADRRSVTGREGTSSGHLNTRGGGEAAYITGLKFKIPAF